MQSTWFRTICLLLAAAGALAAPQPALANPIVPVTLEFEREGVDLDRGRVVPIEFWTRAFRDESQEQPEQRRHTQRLTIPRPAMDLGEGQMENVGSRRRAAQ